MSLFNALIRTHHITSRKKVAKLRQAADACDIFALVRYGGCPGIMYVEGQEKGVREWVDSVHVSQGSFFFFSSPSIPLVSCAKISIRSIKTTRDEREEENYLNFESPSQTIQIANRAQTIPRTFATKIIS